MTFTGFTQDIFDAYAPDRWSSNVYNLPRMKAKDVLVALGQAIEGGLGDDELSGLARGASDEVPNISNQKKVDAQWVFWFRNPDARKELSSFLQKTPLDQGALLNLTPQDKHIGLVIATYHDHVWVGLWLPSSALVDRRNLRMKLEKSWERERFLELAAGLAADLQLQFDGDALALHDVSDAALSELASRLEDAKLPWRLGKQFSRAEVLEADADIVGVFGTMLASLLPMYRYTAWTRDNDFIQASKQIQEEKAQKRKQATSYRKGDKVRVISGLFSGKVGVVQDVDAKAQVRVQVGKMSVVVPGTELVPA
jgi:hypothetical protein